MELATRYRHASATVVYTAAEKTGGVMTYNAAQRLSEVVRALMQRERLTVTDLMRAGGMARNTVEYILKARTQEPERQTIRRLARALATDPRTREMDGVKMADYESLLHVAAGFADPTADQARTLVELGLYYRLQSLDRARAWDTLIDEQAALDPGQIRALGVSNGASS
jgi:transcriptional regulator with XRE-family HTH domain